MTLERNVKKGFKIAGWVILGIVGVSALAVLFGFIVMWLWNRLMGGVFGLPELTYWEAVGLLILAKIFFGSMHGEGGGGGKKKQKKDKSRRWENWDPENWDIDPEDCKHFRKYWNEGGKEHFHQYRDDYSTEEDESIGDTIKNTIKDEIRNEIRKEFEKEMRKDSEVEQSEDQDKE